MNDEFLASDSASALVKLFDDLFVKKTELEERVKYLELEIERRDRRIMELELCRDECKAILEGHLSDICSE